MNFPYCLDPSAAVGQQGQQPHHDDKEGLRQQHRPGEQALEDDDDDVLYWYDALEEHQSDEDEEQQELEEVKKDKKKKERAACCRLQEQCCQLNEDDKKLHPSHHHDSFHVIEKLREAHYTSQPQQLDDLIIQEEAVSPLPFQHPTSISQHHHHNDGEQQQSHHDHQPQQQQQKSFEDEDDNHDGDTESEQQEGSIDDDLPILQAPWGRAPTPQELNLINQLQEALNVDGVVISREYWAANFNESRHGLLWRFLVANDMNIARAKALLIGDIAWRQEVDIIKLQSMSLEEVVGCSREIFDQHYFSAVLGFDEEDDHSPVTYQCLSNMRTSELLKHTTVEKMVMQQLYEFELNAQKLFTFPETFPPRKLKVIIDVSGMRWSQCSPQIIQVLAGFSEASKLHHPERLSKLYIVGAPSLFSMAWNLVRPLIPKATREKINILNASETSKHPWVSFWLSKKSAAAAGGAGATAAPEATNINRP